MCFGHHLCRAPSAYEGGLPPLVGRGAGAVYGAIDEFPTATCEHGRTTTVLDQWSKNRVTCLVEHVDEGRTMRLCPGEGHESIVILEAGEAILQSGGDRSALLPLDAIRAGPQASAQIEATGPCRILVVTMATDKTPKGRRDALEVRKRNNDDWKLYEYEALGQEVFTPDYEGAIGLLRFVFPQDEIPVHVHPASGRIIRPIAGRGYTYMHPERCPMDSGTIAAFDANVIHTNGPLKGQNYELWAIQLPWVTSGIDTENIAGFESFVRYVADVPRPEARKTKALLMDAVRRQSGR
jgi:hypothetical protein